MVDYLEQGRRKMVLARRWLIVSIIAAHWSFVWLLVVLFFNPPWLYSGPAIGAPVVFALWRLYVMKWKARSDSILKYPIHCMSCSRTTHSETYIDTCPNCGASGRNKMIPLAPPFLP